MERNQDQDTKDALQVLQEVADYLQRLPRVEQTQRMERRVRDFLTERSSGAAPIRAVPDYAEGSCYSPAGLGVSSFSVQ